MQSNVDFVDVKKKDIRKLWREKAVAEEQKHVKQFKPFFFKPAKQDFERLIQSKAALYTNEASMVEQSMLSIDLNKFDFSKYSDEKNFKLISEEEYLDTVRLDLTTKQVPGGLSRTYIWNREGEPGYKVTVQVPYSVLEQQKNNK